jgi:four helix bundle protein
VTDRRSDDERAHAGNGGLPKRGYQDLIAWQKAMELVIAVYRVTAGWPREEQYGLTAQARRAAVAIPSNLAEGHGRTGSREFAHHVSIAYGSLCELETQLFIAEQLGYTRAEASEGLLRQVAEVRRLTGGLLRSLQRGTTGTERL